ncbi:hypothetical protein ACHAWF_008135 [Thalassiosira exigua]
MHVYLVWGAMTMYNKYFVLPADGSEVKEWADEYAMAGFPGCISSGDATHIGMLRCHHRLKQHHKSFKLNMPTRTYNMHVTHRRRILHSTPGHPGRWNDQSLQRFDSYCSLLYEGDRFQDLVFELNQLSSDGSMKTVRYCGAWEMRWSTTATCPDALQQMDRVLQKDVECTFGILKVRFRVLKTEIPLHGVDVCDRIWLTCCALHNFLLEEDGLDERWNASRYLFEEGTHDEEDRRRYLGGPAALHDTSGVGVGTDVQRSDCLGTVFEGGGGGQNADEDELVYVQKLDLTYFKSKLVGHFDICWKQHKIRWPSRTGSDPPPTIYEH